MTKLTPIYSGFECKFASPLDEKQYANDMTELTGRAIRYNFENMVVFLRDTKQLVYLKTGVTGVNVSDWVSLTDSQKSIKFEPYDRGNPYVIGEPCAVGIAMFICISPTLVDEDPINYSEKWLRVGAMGKFRVSFADTNLIQISHKFDLPNVRVIVEDVEIYPSIEYVSDTIIEISFGDHLLTGIVKITED